MGVVGEKVGGLKMGGYPGIVRKGVEGKKKRRKNMDINDRK